MADRKARVAALVAGGLLLAGCGGDEGQIHDTVAGYLSAVSNRDAARTCSYSATICSVVIPRAFWGAGPRSV